MAKKMQLDKLLNGALNAMFNREMGRVAMNIYDPNTSPTAKRTITIKLEITPDEERQMGQVSASVTSSLCAVKNVLGKFVFGFNTDTKQGEFAELKTDALNQMTLSDMLNEPDEETIADNVIDLRKRESAE